MRTSITPFIWPLVLFAARDMTGASVPSKPQDQSRNRNQKEKSLHSNDFSCFIKALSVKINGTGAFICLL